MATAHRRRRRGTARAVRGASPRLEHADKSHGRENGRGDRGGATSRLFRARRASAAERSGDRRRLRGRAACAPFRDLAPRLPVDLGGASREAGGLLTNRSPGALPTRGRAFASSRGVRRFGLRRRDREGNLSPVGVARARSGPRLGGRLGNCVRGPRHSGSDGECGSKGRVFGGAGTSARAAGLCSTWNMTAPTPSMTGLPTSLAPLVALADALWRELGGTR